MDIPRPAPGEELNRGAPTAPRAAATVILLRRGQGAIEVLLVRRNPAARFMGGAWVFPGGAVHTHEGSGEPARRRAALRELAEEAGVELADRDSLLLFSRWITPAEVKIRFDAWFYLAVAPPDARPRPDRGEVVDARWYTPEEALKAGRRGELMLVFPTIKHLEELAAFPSVQALASHTRDREVTAVQPRVIGAGERARIVLPGERGYRK